MKKMFLVSAVCATVLGSLIACNKADQTQQVPVKPAMVMARVTDEGGKSISSDEAKAQIGSYHNILASNAAFTKDVSFNADLFRGYVEMPGVTQVKFYVAMGANGQLTSIMKCFDADGNVVADALGGYLSENGHIPAEGAQVLIDNYQHIPSYVEGTSVRSLAMSASLIRDYLSNADITSLNLTWAHSSDHTTSSYGVFSGYTDLTIVISGSDATGKLILNRDQQVDEHALPCPNPACTTCAC